MPRRLIASAIAIAALTLSPIAHAQTAAPAEAGQGRGGRAGGQGQRRPTAAASAPNGQNQNIHLDGWNRKQEPLEATGKKPGPAPVHDVSGIGELAPRYRARV